MTDPLHFKTNVLLKSIIGKDLINNDNIAVLELVKNAYDANSKRTEIIFKNLKQNDDAKVNTYSEKTSKVIIRDWGVGMDIDDIRDKWLNIAYSDKKEKKEEFGRVLAGAKGVGRFSCDRLGVYLDLYTRKRGDEIIHVSISWKDFEVENQKDLQIQQIDVAYEFMSDADFEKKTKYKLFKHGTILEISKLRTKWAFLEEGGKSTWNLNRLLDLRKYLEKLINPNQAFRKDSFEIAIVADEFLDEDESADRTDKVNGTIENKIFEKLDFTTTSIESAISNTGDSITTTLKDKGRTVLHLVERNSTFSLLKDVKIVVYYLNTYAKIYFAKQTGIRSVNFGSIFLFVNGFRVNPLGDEGNDWLGLELRKGQGYARYLGTREVVGRIEINDPEANFKIISSREGIVQDDRYRQIVASTPPYGGYFHKTIRRLERYVAEGLEWDKIPTESLVTPEVSEDSSTFIREFEKKVHSRNWRFNPEEEVYRETQQEKNRRIIHLIYSIINTKPKDIIELYIDSALIESLAEQERAKAQKFLRDFEKYDASILDRKTTDALKRIKSLIKEKERELERAEEKRKLLVQHVERQKRAIAELEESYRRKTSQVLFLQSIKSQDLDNVVHLHHQIGISADTIERQLRNLKQKLDKNQPISNEELVALVQKISFEIKKIQSISRFATKANFSLELSQDIEADLLQFIQQYIENIAIPMLDDIKIDFKNLTTKGFVTKFKPIEVPIVIDNLISNSRKAHARSLDIVAYDTEDNELVLTFRDDGYGLDKRVTSPDEIFDMGFTTTSGSGLGLSHVKQILKELKGSLALNPDVTKGLEFVIKLRK
jgi:signal transduction histidine kinase/anti-sigma regulatory factor (Ser/Thr protein kinase)